MKELAALSGVSPRTLRYYDQIGLLHPGRSPRNDYRVYGEPEVDRLQRILFYRELGVPLEDIAGILDAPGYDRQRALEEHLTALTLKKERLELLIGNVKKTIGTLKGETFMSDSEKFEGFKAKLLEENEARYGVEVSEKYGQEAKELFNLKVKGMSEADWNRSESLRTECETLLAQALLSGDPAGEAAQRACDMHRQWICMFWGQKMYSKPAHRVLVEGYAADQRFLDYYDRLGAGCTDFLVKAMDVYCG